MRVTEISSVLLEASIKMFKSRWCYFVVSLLVCYLHFALLFVFFHCLCNLGVSCVFCIVCVWGLCCIEDYSFHAKKTFFTHFMWFLQNSSTRKDFLCSNIQHFKHNREQRVKGLSVWLCGEECRTSKRSCSSFNVWLKATFVYFIQSSVLDELNYKTIPLLCFTCFQLLAIWINMFETR